ncbi:MAG: hypothetical protein LBS21_14345 [Clostridiales bacterium]|jgi:hypothetical protein|nr:hypothetical protein [Clostridiales bacterium]
MFKNFLKESKERKSRERDKRALNLFEKKYGVKAIDAQEEIYGNPERLEYLKEKGKNVKITRLTYRDVSYVFAISRGDADNSSVEEILTLACKEHPWLANSAFRSGKISCFNFLLTYQTLNDKICGK